MKDKLRKMLMLISCFWLAVGIVIIIIMLTPIDIAMVLLGGKGLFFYSKYVKFDNEGALNESLHN